MPPPANGFAPALGLIQQPDSTINYFNFPLPDWKKSPHVLYLLMPTGWTAIWWLLVARVYIEERGKGKWILAGQWIVGSESSQLLSCCLCPSTWRERDGEGEEEGEGEREGEGEMERERERGRGRERDREG